VTELLKLVTPQDALRKLFVHLTPLLGREEVEVARALDRIAASNLIAPADLPAFPRSTMDGYAVRAADTYGATEGIPAYLEVIGEVPMGRATDIRLALGKAAKVHTGGMLPEGADAVVMVENTQTVDARTIEVVKPVAPGENVLRVGDDIKAKSLLLKAGHRLRPQDIGGLMGIGITKVNVHVKPRVALLSTGDEIVPPDRSPKPGQVRDINSYSLSAAALHGGAEPVLLGIAGDDYERLLETARQGLQQADILVISAGSSVSTRDATARVTASLGKPGVLVHGVAIRPGKPTILAVADGKPVFGLPGNPVSAMVTFNLFVTPTIRLLGGSSNPFEQNTVEAKLARNIASTTGREDYVPVRLGRQEGMLVAEPVFGESNLITTLMRADGMAVVPLNVHGLSAGEAVRVILF
jgi:molybdopterin molybdotransferase